MIEIDVRALDYIVFQKKDRPFTVLQNLNFTIGKGEFVVILGESGCGKSTILQLLAGLIQPTNGKVVVNNTPLNAPDSSISLLFQGSTLLPWLTVADNIQFGCRLRNDVEELPERLDHYLAMMSLTDYRDFFPQQLSVGLSKRVDLARSLIGNPRALLLDEPFAPLDYYNKKRLLQELLDIWQDSSMTCVYVTHDIEEALQLGQKILIMENNPGTIAHEMPIALSYPRNIADRTFISLKNELLDQFGLTFN